MMLTSVPYFREVIVMSFRCEHCGATNNEIHSAGMYLQMKVLYIHSKSYIAPTWTARSSVRKHELSRYRISNLQFPAARGQLTTAEGLLRNIAADLSSDQPTIDGIKEVLGNEEEDEDEAEEAGQVSSTTGKNKEDFLEAYRTPSGRSRCMREIRNKVIF
ncbi:ZPR1 zinc-finger domain-containing protein [Pisolithus croceorrhizus]|nr:ZPR1 zinc-finger domain-containing protein [Pisolithus croceorrhizus]